MTKKQTDVPADVRGLSRRRFAGAAMAGALAAGSQALLGAVGGKAAGSGHATELVTLGRTGIKTSRLAQGTGLNGGARSSAHTRLGEKAFTRLVRHSLERGIVFMDAADLYGSHPYLHTALKGVPWDSYTVLSKIWPRTEYWNSPSGGAKKEVDRFRKELGRDVIDICLIHCMFNDRWPQEYERIRDELAELKQKGAVRAVGVSCHNFGAMKVASTLPWTDVLLARINNVGKSAYMDGTVEEVTAVLRQARSNGKTVIGMKIFGAGRLVKPEQRDASLKYVLGNGLVDAMTVGMMNPGQVDDTIERIDQTLKA